MLHPVSYRPGAVGREEAPQRSLVNRKQERSRVARPSSLLLTNITRRYTQLSHIASRISKGVVITTATSNYKPYVTTYLMFFFDNS